jgi:hypothetical protein
MKTPKASAPQDHPIVSLLRTFAVVATKCPPLKFLALRAFRIEDEEQQDEVESE